MSWSPSLIVDVILAIICIFVLIKYSMKGFLKTILDIARLALSVLLAIMFRGVIANLINSLFMNDAIYKWVNNSVSKHVSGISSGVNFVKIYEDAPEFYSEVLSVFGLDFYELKYAMENLATETVDNVSRAIATPLANMLSTIIAVLVIFIIAMIILYFVVKLICKITKIKLIKVIDKILGIALGIILAAAIVWGLSFVIEIIIDIAGPMYPNVINESLTEESMIINLLKEAGLLDIFEGGTSEITNSVS